MGVEEELVRKDLGRVLLKLEEMQGNRSKGRLIRPSPRCTAHRKEQRAEAMSLLEDPKLLERIVADFARCEASAGKTPTSCSGIWLAAAQHLESPLAIVVQSSSAAGKSSLMDADFCVCSGRMSAFQYSAMTGQALYYMGEMDFKHNVRWPSWRGGRREPRLLCAEAAES